MKTENGNRKTDSSDNSDYSDYSEYSEYSEYSSFPFSVFTFPFNIVFRFNHAILFYQQPHHPREP